ncbi:MAG: SufE family protein [Rickettsiales bacterium]|jgi:cysteine desulfuration protein SufE|nr:SufE family protein [Rickettsiales bacterium]
MNLDDIIHSFGLVPEGEEKYVYIIELGRGLPPYPDGKRTEENSVAGCAASVWMDAGIGADGRWHFKFDSDAAIVKGLLYIILAVFEGKTSREIKNLDISELFGKIGLANHLTARRMSGLASIVGKIRDMAAKAIKI